MSSHNTNTKGSGSEHITWDLESVFPGGSDSVEYEKFRADIKKDLESAKVEISQLPKRLSSANRHSWADFIVKMQEMMSRIRHAYGFAECLISQNVNDARGHQINGEMSFYLAEYQNLMVGVEAFAKAQTDEEWQKLLADEKLQDAEYYLNEMRRIARMKMLPEYESLATELAVNGYHAWNRLYDKVYGDLRVQFDEKGESRELSLGQLAIKMSSPDRAIRRQAFEKLEEAWNRVADWMAMVLNSQAGFRLTLYKRREWDSVLLEPILKSRMKEETLEAMWGAVCRGLPRLKEYIAAKKKLLGIDQFKWYDQVAPVGQVDRKISFAEAGDLIVERINTFSRKQAEFSRMALDRRWIEAEDRPGKAGGGYCTTLDMVKESRIFMTYGDTFTDLSTLAHELGHAYHQHLIRDNSPFAKAYPMTLAETASLFNELLIVDGALGSAEGDDEKLMMMDLKLRNALIKFCNLHARFIFDKSFYEERKTGIIGRTRLDELMVNAQKEAFGGMLEGDDAYHPLFWASKLHFYLTGTPFYNYPYTFGFLFATGVYNLARREGPEFAMKYEALLADTGRMSCEDLAMKHLGTDLTGDDFWNRAVNMALEDVDEFVKLAG
ncbi:MAG: M3 family oligoendopeptidase [Candidatus Zixiibacteriota bacterium]|nr:MAG: M3 family oligoendopeptidase [candidate division Zixibacteria bacterium]